MPSHPKMSILKGVWLVGFMPRGFLRKTAGALKGKAVLEVIVGRKVTLGTHLLRAHAVPQRPARGNGSQVLALPWW